MNGQQTAQPQTCEHWVENLEDGSAVLIRPLREEDRERDKRFLSTMLMNHGVFVSLPGSAAACLAWTRKTCPWTITSAWPMSPWFM